MNRIADTSSSSPALDRKHGRGSQLYTVKRIPSKRQGQPTTYEILGPGAPVKPIASAAIATMIRGHLEKAAAALHAKHELELQAERLNGHVEGLDRVDAAIATLVEGGKAPIVVGRFRAGMDLVCSTDQRVDGAFTLAGVSYTSCILEAALETPTVENRDQIAARNSRLANELLEKGR